jgi:hypothetical protein
MKHYFFEALALLLIFGSLAFFWQCVGALERHDYLAGIFLLCIGVCVINVGAELARLALAERADQADRGR